MARAIPSMAAYDVMLRWTEPFSISWRGWLLPAVFALGTHALALWAVFVHGEGPAFPVSPTISVQLVKPAPPEQPGPAPKRLEKPEKTVVKPKPVEPKVEPSPKPVRKVVSKAIKQPVKPVSGPEPATTPEKQAEAPEPAEASEPVEASAAETQPAIPDSVPDYRAASLHNPPPHYPHAARRRGMQGRVLLHVQVMASGHCGQIEIQKSSGHDILDDAAVEAVKEWHFIPATHLGFAITSWLHIPIRFELTARQ